MRTIYFAVLALLLLYCGGVFAQATGNEFIWNRGGYSKPIYKDAASVCQAVYNIPTQMYHRVDPIAGSNNKRCIYVDSTRPDDPNAYYGVTAEAVEVKKCVSPEVRNWTTGVCQKPPEEEKKCKDSAGTKIYVTIQEGFGPLDGSMDSAPPESSSKYGFPTQNATCKFAGGIDGLTVEHCDSDVVNGQKRYTCTYSAKSSGQEADQSVPGGGGVVTPPASDSKPAKMTPKPIEKGPCPSGSTGGLYDGVLTCYGEGVNPGTSTKAPTTVSETKGTDSNGNDVKTAVKTDTNADGSQTKTTTVTTTKPDGTVDVKTSTEVSKTPTGENGKPDKPETDFCKTNPNLTICKNSTAKASCGAVTCNGDAIQCEMLNQQTTMRCAAEQDSKDLKSSAAYALGSAVLAGNDPLASSLPTPSNGVTIGVPTSLTTSGWLGGGSCFADKSVSVMGKTITLPFSKACEYLLVFRYALMVMASLVSFKILRGAFLSE